VSLRARIRAGLVGSLDARVVDELLDAHEEAKRNYYLGGLRLSAVEGGRFCEAAFRLLEQIAGFARTPIGAQLDAEKLIARLASLPRGTQPDSVRLHIPRALRLVYDIRNARDAAHLADNIDPNLQDATLVVSVLDWVLAEFVRLYHHNVSANEAQELVEETVTRSAPVVQDFKGFLKVLNPNLKAGDHALVLLYHRGAVGATFAELSSWVRPKMRGNLNRTLKRLVEQDDFVHWDGARYIITRRGQQEVERRHLVKPP
jgi:hypothetical protein